jgi:hypothetical protein
MNILDYKKTNARSIKQLLELMLEYQELFKTGLCSWNRTLYVLGYINRIEFDLLSDYIANNIPADALSIIKGAYYWTPTYILPRLEWINKHIELNSNK